MESTPLYPSTPEDDDDDNETEDKPKKNIFRRESLTQKEAKSKEDVGGEIAKSLFTHNNSEKPSLEQDDEEQFEISLEEELVINQALAQEHLEHPVVNEEPLPQVNDFLDLVVEGQEPEQAFEQVLESNNLEEDLAVENIVPNETDSVEPEEVLSNTEEPSLSNDGLLRQTPSRENPHPLEEGPSVIAPPTNVSNGENIQSSNQRPSRAESSRSDNQVANRSISGELAAYIVGRRVGERKTRESEAKKQKKLGKKIKQMEDRLEKQELIIQQASQKKKIESRSVTPPERTQPGSKESRLSLTKPEQAGHLGQILVESKALGITRAPSEAQPGSPLNKKPESIVIPELSTDITSSNELPPIVNINESRLTSPLKQPAESIVIPELSTDIPSSDELSAVVNITEARPIPKENTKPIERQETKDNKNQLKDVVKAEQIKTIPRNELLRISSSIVVEGANLRSMFESNLFGEQALRRLVADKLKGKDIRPLLKREILEKQRDFERDPMVRGRSHFQSETGSQIFTKMLDNTSINQSSSQVANNKSRASAKVVDTKSNLNTTKKDQLNKRSGQSLLLLMIIVFVVVILLAAYLLLHH